MTTETVTASRSRGQLIAIIAAAVVAIGGIALWMYQLSAGMVNTNMRNLDAWGFYIIMFMLFVGLSAGGLIISSVPRVFGLSGFGGISKVATWTSIVCTVLAIGFVIVDLGGPARLWHLVAYANMTSPLMWDIVVLTLYLIVSVVYLWATLRVEKGRGSVIALRVLSVVALFAAVMVHTVTAWIFGLQPSHELWYTALLGPWFVSSALVSGLALVLLVVITLDKTGYLRLEEGVLGKLARLLGVFVAVDLYFFACELLTTGFPGAAGADIVAMLVSGPLAAFFWVEIVASIAVLAVAFMPSLRKTEFVATASLLAIVAIFCKRVQLLVGGFQVPNIDYPAVTSGPSLTDAGARLAEAAPSLVYVPSPLEFGVVLGVLGLGVFLLLVGLRVLPLKPAR